MEKARYQHRYAPWHFCYIDAPDIAAEITDRGSCFEEYREKGLSEASTGDRFGGP